MRDFISCDGIWVSKTEKDSSGKRVNLSGEWIADASQRNLYSLAKSYDFIAEFMQSFSFLPLRRQLLQTDGDDRDRKRVNKELAQSIQDGNISIACIMNCAHLACELALKQFHVRAAYCDGNHLIHDPVLPGKFFPATHSISQLFTTLPVVHQDVIQTRFEQWQTKVGNPFNHSKKFAEVIRCFSDEQMEIRYSTIEDRDNEVWIAVTTISRFLCRGLLD